MSTASDGPGKWVLAGRRAVSNTKSSDCCTAYNIGKTKDMHFIVFIQTLPVRCYSNIKCEINVWNRTESREYLNSSTTYVCNGVINVGMKITLLIEKRYKTWNLKYVNGFLHLLPLDSLSWTFWCWFKIGQNMKYLTVRSNVLYGDILLNCTWNGKGSRKFAVNIKTIYTYIFFEYVAIRRWVKKSWR